MTHDDEDDIDAAIYVSLTHETKFIRVMDTLLIPTKVNIRADLSPGDGVSNAALIQAVMKIKVWLDAIVSRTIAFSADNFEAYGMFFDDTGATRTENQIMLMPGAPSDDVLATVFQSKMQALAGPDIEISLCEIKSDNAAGIHFTFVGDPLTVLPDMKEWLGERTFFAEPWWNRDDGSTYDIIPPPDADLSQKPAWAFKINVSSPATTVTDQADVVRPKFRPKVIDGGPDVD